MPIVIVLDNSLSMCKYVDDNTSLTKRDCSHLIINRLADHLTKVNSYEHLALIAYSSEASVLCQFTREYNVLKDALVELPIGDCARLESAFNCVSDLVLSEWTNMTNISVLLITNDIDTLHSDSVKHMCIKLRDNLKILQNFYVHKGGCDFDENEHFSSLLNNEELLKSTFYADLPVKNYFQCKFPFSFPNRLDIVCLNELNNNNNKLKTETLSNNKVFYYDTNDSFNTKYDKYQDSAKTYYLQDLIHLNNSPGKLFLTKNLQQDYLETKFCSNLFAELYSPFDSKIKCGHIESNILLTPNPLPFKG
jgi:hypothetical protein